MSIEKIESASTEVTDENIADGIEEDEFGELYSRDGQRLFRLWEYNVTSYTIRNGTKIICDRAFKNCYYLRELTIPFSVTHIGDGAFYKCESLREVILPSSVTNIGNKAFEWCASLQELVIPSSVTGIGDGA